MCIFRVRCDQYEGACSTKRLQKGAVLLCYVEVLVISLCWYVFEELNTRRFHKCRRLITRIMFLSLIWCVGLSALVISIYIAVNNMSLGTLSFLSLNFFTTASRAALYESIHCVDCRVIMVAEVLSVIAGLFSGGFALSWVRIKHWI